MKTFSQSFSHAKKRFSVFLNRFFKKKRTRIGIYGPPMQARPRLQTVSPATGPETRLAR